MIQRKPPLDRTSMVWLGATVLAIGAWFAIYGQLKPFSEWAVSHMPLTPGSHAAEAITFFIYDTPKVLMLLTLVVFGMGVVRSFFSPERTRAVLAGRREGVGNVAAASLGDGNFPSAPARPCRSSWASSPLASLWASPFRS